MTVSDFFEVRHGPPPTVRKRLANLVGRLRAVPHFWRSVRQGMFDENVGWLPMVFFFSRGSRPTICWLGVDHHRLRSTVMRRLVGRRGPRREHHPQAMHAPVSTDHAVEVVRVAARRAPEQPMVFRGCRRDIVISARDDCVLRDRDAERRAKIGTTIMVVRIAGNARPHAVA
jgi:hypothetical protein